MSKKSYSPCPTTDFYQLSAIPNRHNNSSWRYKEIERIVDSLSEIPMEEVEGILRRFGNLDANSNVSPTSLLVNETEKDERLKTVLFRCVAASPSGNVEQNNWDRKQFGIFDTLAPLFSNTILCKSLLLSATRNTDMTGHIVAKYPSISLNYTSDQLETILHICCINGTERPFKAVLSALLGKTLSKVELAELLIQKDSRGRTALHYACAHGNLPMVTDVNNLCTKADLPFTKLLREKDSEGHSCLSLAIMSPSLKLTKFLLNSGADISLGGIYALCSPLHVACWFANRGIQPERLEIVKELLNRGAKVALSDSSSGSAVHIAAYGHGGQSDGQVLKWLIETKDDKETLRSRDKDGSLPIHIAAKYGTVEQMRTILDADQYLLVETNSEGLSPLHISLSRSVLDVKIVDLMLEFANDPNDKKLLGKLVNLKSHKTYQTALHLAATTEDFHIFSSLLHSGSEFRAKDIDGETPLLIAVAKGFKFAVMELVEMDRFALEDVNNRQESWLHKAILNGQTELVEEFKSSTSPYELMRCAKYEDNMLSPIELSASLGECKILEILLEILEVADLRYDLQRYGDSYAGLLGKSLKAAALSQHNGVEVVKILLKHPKSIEQKIEGKNGLDWALENDNFAMIQVILESKYWQEAMRNSYANEDFPAITPMRKLVAKNSELAKLLLDRCMTINEEKSEKSEKSKLPPTATFNYEFIDDVFAINEWKDNSNWIPYSTNGYTVKINHVISHMVDCERVELLNHPVVKSFVYHRWRKYGKIFMTLMLLFYSTFMALLSGYAWHTPAPYQNETDTNAELSTTTNKHQDNFVAIAKWGVCLLAVLYILKELVELVLKKLKYFQQLDNWIETILFPLAIVFVLKGSLDSDTHWLIGCVALFLGWINFLLFLRKIRQIGVQVLMFTRVATTFAKFLIVFILFAMAFGFPFYLLVRNHSGFKSLGLSMVKVGVMAVGENTLFDHSVKTSLEEEIAAVYYPYTTIAFLVLFLFLVTTVLKNMLEGLAVGDIQKELAQSKLRKLKLQTDFVLDLESVIISNWRWSKSLVKRTDFFIRTKTIRLYDRFQWSALKSRCCQGAKPPLFPQIPFSTAKEIIDNHQRQKLKTSLY